MGAPLVPPLKCQGIKTKLVAEIARLARSRDYGRWVEPFCGSCVVALNVRPRRALLTDVNPHIIRLYQDIQRGALTDAGVVEFLQDEGKALKARGEAHYYRVRERFNAGPTSLDFLFLNRSCFNGVIRFNRKGGFNVPFCRKDGRFAPAYITKIANQVKRVSRLIALHDWEFAVADYRETLGAARAGDLVYADPPYAGRHVDYYNAWSEADEETLARLLKALPCDFILSTWLGNEFRENPGVERDWRDPQYHIFKRDHFYHVGSRETLRHPMLEGLVTNFPVLESPDPQSTIEQPSLFSNESGS